jgi:hypothetical protein
LGTAVSGEAVCPRGIIPTANNSEAPTADAMRMVGRKWGDRVSTAASSARDTCAGAGQGHANLRRMQLIRQ